jgi:hypothetical protein
MAQGVKICQNFKTVSLYFDGAYLQEKLKDIFFINYIVLTGFR